MYSMPLFFYFIFIKILAKNWSYILSVDSSLIIDIKQKIFMSVINAHYNVC